MSDSHGMTSAGSRFHAREGRAPEDSLAAAIDALALLVQADRDAAAEQIAVLAERASDLGREDLAQRARLVEADVIGRRGDTAASAVIERSVLAWATEHDDGYLIARAERLQATFYTRIGDSGAALECAIVAMDRLPSDVPALMLADHLMCLALAYSGMRSFGPARERFLAVVALAADLGEHELHIRALNNLAFMEYLAERPKQSLRIADQLMALADSTGLRLNASALETIARAQMSMGSYPEAEQTLIRALDHPDRITDSDDVAEIHLTSAECQRLCGHLESARESLGRALDLCDERGLDGVRVRVVEEQSALAAATGDFRTAYELYQEFHRLEAELLSAARDSRARILAVVFETKEAIRSSERYREMSVRDPLTGLYNRRGMEERMPGMLRQVNDASSSLSIAIADLDHFKRINDQCSHEVGDVVLRQLAPLLEAACPPGGFAARLGGEEFLLVFPRHDSAQARAACEALVLAVRRHPWGAVVADLPVTISIGVTTAHSAEATMKDLLSAADLLLYEAKRGGRDRVVADPDDRDMNPAGTPLPDQRRARF
jgi:two-component system, cell cycle response regulator